MVVTIYDDDEHLFPALQAGAFGYLLKEQPREQLVAQLLRIIAGRAAAVAVDRAARAGATSPAPPGRRAALVQQLRGARPA